MGMPDAYKCHICGKYFKFDEGSERDQHYATRHPGHSPPTLGHNAFQCHECSDNFFDVCTDRDTHYDANHAVAQRPGKNHRPCSICQQLYPDWYKS